MFLQSNLQLVLNYSLTQKNRINVLFISVISFDPVTYYDLLLNVYRNMKINYKNKAWKYVAKLDDASGECM